MSTDVEYITVMEAINRMDKLKDHGNERDFLFFSFLLFSELRIGEILGLRWQDLDYGKCEIHARNLVCFPNGQYEPTIIAFPDETCHSTDLQYELRKRIEPYKNEEGYILPSSKDDMNHPMTRHMFEEMWMRINSTLNLKGSGPTAIRKTFVKMMNLRSIELI